MPPFGFLPALALSLVPAVWLLDGDGQGLARPAGAFQIRRLPRLVLGLRLFRRRPLVARCRLPGRGRPVRLGDALRRAGPAGRSRVFSRLRLRPRPPVLAARCLPHPRLRLRPDGQRMAARPPLHRLSLEHPRHGARPEPLAHAVRLAGRSLRPDLLALCIGAAPAVLLTGRTPRRRWTAPALAGALLVAMLAAFGALAPPRRGLAQRAGCAAAHHAAQPAAGRQVQSAQPRRHHAALPGPERQARTDRREAGARPISSGRNRPSRSCSTAIRRRWPRSPLSWNRALL